MAATSTTSFYDSTRRPFRWVTGAGASHRNPDRALPVRAKSASVMCALLTMIQSMTSVRQIIRMIQPTWGRNSNMCSFDSMRFDKITVVSRRGPKALTLAFARLSVPTMLSAGDSAAFA